MLLTHTSNALSRNTEAFGNFDSRQRSNHHEIHQDLQSIKCLLTTEIASNTQRQTNVESQIRSNHHEVHQDLQSIKYLLATGATSNTQRHANIESQTRSNYDHILKELRSVKDVLISQSQDSNRRLPSQAGLSAAPTHIIPYAPVASYVTPVGGAARIFPPLNDQPSMANSNQGVTGALAISSSALSPSQISDTFDTVETVIRSIMAYVLIALEEFLTRLPQVLIIARMIHVLPRAISLMGHDCIRFEDALGRIQNLQYQHFRDWPIFEALVKSHFEGVPGNGKILRRQYTLTCPRLPGQRIVAANWNRHVFPGMTVFMAVDVEVNLVQGATCPKCSSRNTSSRMATGSHRCSCGLVFSKGFSANAKSVAGGTNSESGCEDETPKNGRSRSGTRTGPAGRESINLDDDSTDSEDEAENLKVFKRVHLLQRSTMLSMISPNFSKEKYQQASTNIKKIKFFSKAGRLSEGSVLLDEQSSFNIVARRLIQRSKPWSSSLPTPIKDSVGNCYTCIGTAMLTWVYPGRPVSFSTEFAVVEEDITILIFGRQVVQLFQEVGRSGLNFWPWCHDFGIYES